MKKEQIDPNPDPDPDPDPNPNSNPNPNPNPNLRYEDLSPGYSIWRSSRREF